ncbi:hypothetical protein RI129_003293 [Pyrocoelia pectoralis]|uniref:Uncharacterized protein n=1 Tax=Pyrocoelia pectoralis TaxID=417401 RepID=A0AAN7VNP5_9COLE
MVRTKLEEFLKELYQSNWTNTIFDTGKPKKLIYEHHSLVKSHFGHLLPTHHIMIHYPSIIRKMGPLIHLWCMRFEAKHGYFKDLVNKLKKFKNLPKTLAERHQMFMHHSWVEKKNEN